jgi:formylglycine-generating enzyme required for sulfatase activity
MHSAAEWVLRRWKVLEEAVASGPVPPSLDERGLGWQVTARGDTLLIVRRPSEFMAGASPGEAPGEYIEAPRRCRPAPFAIATRKTTVAQMRQFWPEKGPGSLPGHPADEFAPGARPDHPAAGVNFHIAARYCNWLSEREGIPPAEWCFEPEDDRRMRPRPGHLRRQGYRLPTEEEWEYACRADTLSCRFFGQSKRMLPHYAWYRDNSAGGPSPVAQLKPNDFGLFDVLGNVQEWCVDSFRAGDQAPVVQRGGSFRRPADLCRCSLRSRTAVPDDTASGAGFRVARSLLADQ